MAVELERVIFDVKHLEVANLKRQEFEGVGFSQNTFERIEGMASMGVAMTLMWDGRIIGFTGFMNLWPGVVEVWLIPTKYVGDKPLLLVRTLKKYIEGIAEDQKLWRIQTIAIADPVHARFLECLGFQCEGTARSYVKKGQDHKYWSRIF